MTTIAGLSLGKVLAIVGLILTIVLIVIGKLALLTGGLLFGLAFLAILLL